jgi:quercetin dioxygenase-like cupin family protein
VLCDVNTVSGSGDQAGGALWRLDAEQRHLDANVIALGPNRRIDTHTGPDLDVLMLVLSGAGEVEGADGAITAAAGSLIWLPRRSQRSIVAGPDGLRYLTVHPRRPALSIGTPEAARR